MAGGRVLFFRKKRTQIQVVELLMERLWAGVVGHGSQDLATACNIQGEWLTKEMLALAYYAALRSVDEAVSTDWKVSALALSGGLRTALVRELVASLNEIEWQIMPWLEGAKGAYGSVDDPALVGRAFFNRVAATETDALVIRQIEDVGGATYYTVRDAVAALPKKIKVI